MADSIGDEEDFLAMTVMEFLDRAAAKLTIVKYEDDEGNPAVLIVAKGPEADIFETAVHNRFHHHTEEEKKPCCKN